METFGLMNQEEFQLLGDLEWLISHDEDDHREVTT